MKKDCNKSSRCYLLFSKKMVTVALRRGIRWIWSNRICGCTTKENKEYMKRKTSADASIIHESTAQLNSIGFEWNTKVVNAVDER